MQQVVKMLLRNLMYLTIVSSFLVSADASIKEEASSFFRRGEKYNSQNTIDAGSSNFVSNFGGSAKVNSRVKPNPDCSVCGITNDNGESLWTARATDGQNELYPLIKNGFEVNPPNKFPWMVVSANTGSVCGGAILNKKFILSAAHCFTTENSLKQINDTSCRNSKGGTVPCYHDPSEVRVNFLTSDAGNLSPSFPVKRIIPHPDYISSGWTFDIVLLELADAITCDSYKNPICLPPANFKISPDSFFTVAGWGDSSKYLTESFLKPVAIFECISDKDSGYCMMGQKGTTIVSGDSGGPMFGKYNGNTYLIGVLSGIKRKTPKEKGDPDEVIAFASVPYFVEWISKVTGIVPQEISYD